MNQLNSSLLIAGMMNAAGGMHSYGANGAMIAENGDTAMGVNMHQMNVYEQMSQHQQSCLPNEVPPAVPTCQTSNETSSLMPVVNLQATSPKKSESDGTQEVQLDERTATPSSEVNTCLQQDAIQMSRNLTQHLFHQSMSSHRRWYHLI